MEKIKQLYSECEKSMKIYVYPFYPTKYTSLYSFINHIKNDKNYNLGGGHINIVCTLLIF